MKEVKGLHTRHFRPKSGFLIQNGRILIAIFLTSFLLSGFTFIAIKNSFAEGENISAAVSVPSAINIVNYESLPFTVATTGIPDGEKLHFRLLDPNGNNISKSLSVSGATVNGNSASPTINLVSTLFDGTHTLQVIYDSYILDTVYIDFVDEATPSNIISSNFQIIEDNYIKTSGPISKINFVRSFLTDTNNFSIVLSTNTSRVKTGDTVEIYRKNGSSLVKTYTIAVKGDVTGDGEVNLSDFAKLYQYARGETSLNKVYKISGDVNNNGSITLSDVSKLYQYVKGAITSL